MTPLREMFEQSGLDLWRVAAALNLRNTRFEQWLETADLPDEKAERVRRCIRLMQNAKSRGAGNE